MNEIIQKKIVYRLAQKYLRENTLKLVERLKKYDYMDRNDIEGYIIDKFCKLIDHAYNTTEYYKDLFDKHQIDVRDIKTLKDIARLPLLTKNQLRDNFDRLISKERFPKVSKVHSGGTMGQSIFVLKDNYSLSYDRAVKGKCLTWHGCSIGDKEFRFWAYPFDKLGNFKAAVIDHLLNRRRVSPIHLNEKKVIEMAGQINSFQPKIIYGWVSGIYKFSEMASGMNISINKSNIKLIITTAEKLYNYQRKVIERIWGLPVIDEYGCSEAGVIGFECSAGKKHIQVENNYLEVINKGKYNNGIGELVVTNLNNFKMPLIRYEIGDLARIDESYCKCGRTTPLIFDIDGRVLDILINSRGEVVLGEVFCYIAFDLIDKYKKLKDFRIYQNENGSIDIYYIPSPSFRKDFLNIFEKEIRKHMGEGLKITFKQKEDFTSIDCGKPKYVVSFDSRKNDLVTN